MDRHEDWKDHVRAVGGSLRKDKNGKYYGVLDLN